MKTNMTASADTNNAATIAVTPWWQAPETDDIECHTARVWGQIARAARAAGDIRRAAEAEEAADRESR